MKDLKAPRIPSESSTTSDNTSDFIEIVKKFDVVYNTQNPDYKNIEMKQKIWLQIAEEIGLSVEASKRKWKNLRDSYTKYLRSFRAGSKTSKKYQFWAHADHMDFLKPYQGPGRNTTSLLNIKSNDDDDTECDLGFQVLAKATNSSSEDDMIMSVPRSSGLSHLTNTVSMVTSGTLTETSISSPMAPELTTSSITPMAGSPITTAKGSRNLCYKNFSVQPSSLATVAAMPSSTLLPKPSSPPLAAKHLFVSLANESAGCVTESTKHNETARSLLTSSTSRNIPDHCAADLILMNNEGTAQNNTSISGATVDVVQNGSISSVCMRTSQPIATKTRKIHPSTQQTAVNLTHPNNSITSHVIHPPPLKVRKSCNQNIDLDVAAVLHANRDLDANTLFFLSLARQVRSMPTKSQSLAKIRCMRIISEIELELEEGEGRDTQNVYQFSSNYKHNHNLFETPATGTYEIETAHARNEAASEHFLYVMSPSRVENMIDISSDEESAAINRN